MFAVEVEGASDVLVVAALASSLFAAGTPPDIGLFPFASLVEALG